MSRIKDITGAFDAIKLQIPRLISLSGELEDLKSQASSKDCELGNLIIEFEKLCKLAGVNPSSLVEGLPRLLVDKVKWETRDRKTPKVPVLTE